jgi:RNA polymerase sigma-70 factor (ECF subfamily)
MASREWVQAETLRHSEHLRGVLFLILGRHDAADDAFQELFLVLGDKADSFREGTDFLAWARTVARYVALRLVARDRRHRGLDPAVLELVADEAERMARDGDDGEAERLALRRCLERLGPSARRILALRYESGLTPAAIGERLGRTASAIAVALSRSRAFLRACVDRRLAGPP